MADPITFVIDISHHQDKSLNLAQTRRDGCELCLMKAGEGSSFVDPDFASNLVEARAAGQLVGAYWYQRGNVSAAAHVAKIKQVVPKDVPVVLDVEHGSGGVALTREIIRLLTAEGYRTPLLYIPRWYWQQLGSPSLAGLPPLWSSRYPDNRVGTLASEWADVPTHFWDGYGGLPVALLQFTSSARIAGYAPLDASAFRGTRAQLAALLGGQTQEELVASPEEIQAIAKATVNELMSRGVTTGEPETKNEIPFSRHVRYTQFDAAKAAAGVAVLLGRSEGASAEEIAAQLLPALSAAVVAELAERDAISDQDAQKIAQAVTDRAAVLLGGGQ
ncbi:hypothetical protein DMC63_01230 [Streptomyces sp. WAC 05977]|nr:hypothetical protein DMC63_01230 [Streptomyces sp. WAC 05977]